MALNYFILLSLLKLAISASPDPNYSGRGALGGFVGPIPVLTYSGLRAPGGFGAASPVHPYSNIIIPASGISWVDPTQTDTAPHPDYAVKNECGDESSMHEIKDLCDTLALEFCSEKMPTAMCESHKDICLVSHCIMMHSVPRLQGRSFFGNIGNFFENAFDKVESIGSKVSSNIEKAINAATHAQTIYTFIKDEVVELIDEIVE